MQRCLDKDPKQRLRDIGDARVEIEQMMRAPNEEIDGGVAVLQTRTWRRRTRVAIAAAVAFALSSAGLIFFALTRDNAAPVDTRVSRFTVDLQQGQVIVPTFNFEPGALPWMARSSHSLRSRGQC